MRRPLSWTNKSFSVKTLAKAGLILAPCGVDYKNARYVLAEGADESRP